MFKITTEDFSGQQKIKLLNERSGEYVSVIPGFGGNLNELVLQKNGKLHHIIAGDKQLETLEGKGGNYYRGAKLSPFPNRINHGKYTYENWQYQIKLNNPPHALHGLLWNMPFDIKEQVVAEDFARLVLHTKYESLHKGYPFTYHIEIEYLLKENNLKCSTKIKNKGEQAMPIGDGWHPYFATGSKIDSLKLQLPANRQLEMKDLIPTGNHLADKLFEHPTFIGNTQLDHCFELDKNESTVETKIIDEQKDICIVVWQDAGKRGYRFIQAYTPPDRNSIAIEPMSCAPDAFNNKNGLIILEPEELIEFCFGVRLE